VRIDDEQKWRSQSEIQFRKEGEVSVCSIDGRVDAVNAVKLKKEFNHNLDSSSMVVMDLKDVEYIDSTGLGALVACLKYAVEAGGNVKISRLQAKARMVFEITRAYKIFDIYDDIAEAVASYSR
jgi:anti-sigma B factor antagonist